MESTQPSPQSQPQSLITNTRQTATHTFEPYKTYLGLHDQNKNVIYDWLCKCDKAPDDLDSVKCDNKECDFWGHKSCHGYSPNQDLQNVKHICDHCRSQLKRGRKKIWRQEERKLLMKLKNEEKYEWIRISRALHRTIDECKNEYEIKNKTKHKNQNNNETVDNSNNNSKKKAKKNKDYYCDECDRSFSNGKAYGGHMGAHTRRDRKKSRNVNNFNDYSSDSSVHIEVSKVIHKTRNRMEKRKSNNNILISDDSDSISDNISDSISESSVEVVKENRKKRKKIKKRKKEESENEFEDEPPNKKVKLNNNKNNKNNNEEKWQNVTFKDWKSEETIKFFENTIDEFKMLLENKKEGCNIRRNWKESNMNGANLLLMCEKNANWALRSVGIKDMGIQIKIMDSIQNKM